MAIGITGGRLTVAKPASEVYQRFLIPPIKIGKQKIDMREKPKRRANSFTETEFDICCELLGTALRGGAMGRGVTRNPNFLSLYRKFAKMRKLIEEQAG